MLLLGLSFIAVLGVYLYFFSFLNSSYSPYYGDEYFYFQNARSFAENTSLQASFTYFGEGSKVWGADAHGPAYPLLYGSVSKLVGWQNLVIPLTNLVIFLAAVLALARSGRAVQATRIQQLLLVIGSPVTLFYSVSFMPELLHLAGGILLFVFCKKYLKSLSNRDFVWFIVLIFFLGLLRNTWFFALFGLLVLPGPLVGLWRLVYPVLGTLLPYLFQAYFHEQVPNTFTDLGKILREGQIVEALDILILNFKRNIYFGIYYTEGWFYTLQKIWWFATATIAILYFRSHKPIRFGLLVFAILVLFNVVVYKNYTWIDIRLYTAMVIFLNLEMIASEKKWGFPSLLLGLNLASFVLILPLQNQLLDYRLKPDVAQIPNEIIAQLQNLPPGLIYVSPELLHSYDLSMLPVETRENKALRYLLPYFEIEDLEPGNVLILSNGQLTVCSRNILNQKITPRQL